jgi:sugar lactone lactonase YvrE
VTAAPEVDVLARVGGALLEGPSWDAARGCVLLVDIGGARRHAVDWDSGSVVSHAAPETTTAWIPRAAGGTVVVGRRGLRFADEDGEGPLVLEVEAERRGNRSNDAKCDPAGRLWLGTMAEDEEPFAGSLYRVDPDLALTRVLEGTTISNGLGWSPDGRRMYFVDSPTQRVDVFDYEPDDGTASGRRPLVDTGSLPGVPDGLAVDGEGCLWVVMHDGAAVIRISPEGEHLATVVVPVARPTSCCFAGPELDRLVITSARDAGGLGGDLFVCDAGIAGLPTTAFAG